METIKHWLKSDRTVTADVFNLPPDAYGGVPSLVYQTNQEGGEPQPAYALVRIEEWTSDEPQPAPEGTVDTGYLVIYQNDKSDVSYLFVTTEDAARQSLAYDKAVGYVPVSVDTNCMTAKDAPPTLESSDTLST
jgi:hypothetical protein